MWNRCYAHFGITMRAWYVIPHSIDSSVIVFRLLCTVWKSMHLKEGRVGFFFYFFFLFLHEKEFTECFMWFINKATACEVDFTNLYEKGINQNLNNVIYICCLVKLFIYTPSSNNQFTIQGFFSLCYLGKNKIILLYIKNYLIKNKLSTVQDWLILQALIHY